MRATVLLPLPLSPTRAVIVPGFSVEGDVVDRVHVRTAKRVPDRELLREALHLERRLAGAHALCSSTRWQATQCPGATSRSTGRSLVCRR